MNTGVIITETILSRKPPRSGSYAGLLTLAIVFGASVIYWENFWNLAGQMPGNREAVLVKQEYWRLLTGILVHADLRHFFSNLIPLVFLSSILFGYFGFRVYPLSLWLIAGGVNLAALWTYPPEVTLVGASGLVYCMAAFWLTLYLFVERRFSFGKRLVRSLGFALVMLVPTTLELAVSYRSHAIGFGAGVLAAIVYFARNKQRLRQAEEFELDEENRTIQ